MKKCNNVLKCHVANVDYRSSKLTPSFTEMLPLNNNNNNNKNNYFENLI